VNRLGRAIQGAGAAFHAGVAADDLGLTVFQPKHRMRANGKAHPAPDAALGVQFESHHVLEIGEIRHWLFPQLNNREVSHNPSAVNPVPISSGTA
jgi:hypothetical protein